MNDNQNKKHTPSQNRRILDYMIQGNTINPIVALEKFQCFRLGARIADIESRCRYDGIYIKHEWGKSPDGKRYMTYRIETDNCMD